YTSDTEIAVSVTLEPDQVTDEDSQQVDISIIGELEKGYSIEGNKQGDKQELYFEGSDFYLVENDQWVHYPDSGPVNYPSWYLNVVESLVSIYDLIEAEVTGGRLELMYEDVGLDVFRAFEETFDLHITGVQEEDILVKLEVTVNEESFYIEEFHLEVVGEPKEEDVELGRVVITVDAEYSDYNEVYLNDIEEDVA